VLPAVGATASDHPEFLWRVVNLFLKVRVPKATTAMGVGLVQVKDLAYRG
jgi:hypothetical protein